MNKHFIMLIDSVGQEFRQGTLRMVCICSPKPGLNFLVLCNKGPFSLAFNNIVLSFLCALGAASSKTFRFLTFSFRIPSHPCCFTRSQSQCHMFYSYYVILLCFVMVFIYFPVMKSVPVSTVM